MSAFVEHQRQYRGHPGLCRTFSRYLDRIEEGAYHPEHPDSRLFIHGAPQHCFVTRRERPLVRRIFRFDDERLIVRIGEWIGRRLEPRFENSLRGNAEFRLNRNDLGRIRKIYRDDVALWDRINSLK